MGASRPPDAAMLDVLRSRYDAFAERVLCSLNEIEREDVRSFDRWFYRGGGWRWLVGIVALTTAVAFAASWLPWNMRFVEAAVLFNVIVLTLLWSGLAAWFGYRKFSGKLFRYIVAGPLLAILATFVGASIAGVVKGIDPLTWLQDSAKVRHVVTAGLVFGVLYVLVVALIANLRNREYRALAARLESEARHSELSRQLAESRLRMLQLQIEPHFLFNSLGSAQQLAEKGAPEAARLIADLIRFLRAASPALREDATTLAQERSLIEAYLGIMKVRLAGRLAWAVDIPAALDDARVPPGMLITLVENAIKHGIEPSPDGGRVDVRAERRGDGRLVLTVRDTGGGSADLVTSGQGIGLANIRERLALLFDGNASLEVGANAPRGFAARIALPPEAASPPPGAASRRRAAMAPASFAHR
jgi:signal transduction histidine kinase